MFLSNVIATILMLRQHSSASGLPTSPTLNKERVHTLRIPLLMIYKIYIVIWKQNNLLPRFGHFILVLLLKIKNPGISHFGMKSFFIWFIKCIARIDLELRSLQVFFFSLGISKEYFYYVQIFFCLWALFLA